MPHSLLRELFDVAGRAALFEQALVSRGPDRCGEALVNSLRPVTSDDLGAICPFRLLERNSEYQAVVDVPSFAYRAECGNLIALLLGGCRNDRAVRKKRFVVF
jgi:hypothetical protein